MKSLKKLILHPAQMQGVYLREGWQGQELFFYSYVVE